MIILITEETVTQWLLSSHLSFQIDCLVLECVQVTLALGNFVPIAQKRAAKEAAGYRTRKDRLSLVPCRETGTSG